MKQTTPPQGSIKLPHGAWLEIETAQVCIPTETQILSFAASELDDFAEILDDILTVLSSNAKLNIHICGTCGSTIQDIEYTEPEGEDLQ